MQNCVLPFINKSLLHGESILLSVDQEEYIEKLADLASQEWQPEVCILLKNYEEEVLLSVDQEEYLKKLADITNQKWQPEVYILLKDFSRWFRYNRLNKKSKAFEEFIDREYTNPEFRTY